MNLSLIGCSLVSKPAVHRGWNAPLLRTPPKASRPDSVVESGCLARKGVFVILNEVKNLDLHMIRSFAGAQDDKLPIRRADSVVEFGKSFEIFTWDYLGASNLDCS